MDQNKEKYLHQSKQANTQTSRNHSHIVVQLCRVREVGKSSVGALRKSTMFQLR
jgi:hypothetical protein